MDAEATSPELMDYLIHWAGFLGGWLLVAGPLFQASVELRDEQFDSSKFDSVKTQMSDTPRISGWWWLLPPVAYVKSLRRAREHRDSVMLSLTSTEREQLVGFMNKANGWAFVAVGAFFIALKETYELVELYYAPIALFWIGIVVMSIIAIANTVIRSLQADGVIHVGETERPGRRRGAARSQRTAKDDTGIVS